MWRERSEPTRIEASEVGRDRALDLRTAGLALMGLLLAAVSAAVDLPLPRPDPDRGTIAVTMRGRFPAGNKGPAVQVHFVRPQEQGEMFAAESVIPSNFSKKKQVYLLNARPGRYVAVGAEIRGPGRYTIFPNRAAIAATEIEVVAGEITFMGDYLFDLKVKMKQADPAQAHYLRLIAPGAARKGFMARAYTSQNVYRAELVGVDREPATANEFWSMARDGVFVSEPAWRAEVEEELAELAADLQAARASPEADGPGGRSFRGVRWELP